MSESFEEILHPRIVEQCMPRYRDGYFKDAAREAMTQLERSIKEKAGLTDNQGTRLFGVNLCSSVFGPGSGIKLRVPFGQHMQEPARGYFEKVFAYYRNYSYHEGDRIDGRICLRILVVASDLLYLVDASRVSFANVGGVEGLVQKGVFHSSAAVLELLSSLDGQCLPDQVCDGFYETLGKRGFEEKHVQALFDCGLVEYTVNTGVEDLWGLVDEVGIFHLTTLGENLLKPGAL